jgi:hypothetical protein
VSIFSGEDHFDIYTIVTSCKIDLLSQSNKEILKAVFKAKRVPIEFLGMLENDREFHRDDFRSVVDTIKPGIKLKRFDFYFDFVKSIAIGYNPFG